MEFVRLYGVPRLQSSNIAICSANKDCGGDIALAGEVAGWTDLSWNAPAASSVWCMLIVYTVLYHPRGMIVLAKCQLVHSYIPYNRMLGSQDAGAHSVVTALCFPPN